MGISDFFPFCCSLLFFPRFCRVPFSFHFFFFFIFQCQYFFPPTSFFFFFFLFLCWSLSGSSPIAGSQNKSSTTQKMVQTQTYVGPFFPEFGSHCPLVRHVLHLFVLSIFLIFFHFLFIFYVFSFLISRACFSCFPIVV